MAGSDHSNCSRNRNTGTKDPNAKNETLRYLPGVLL